MSDPSPEGREVQEWEAIEALSQVFRSGDGPAGVRRCEPFLRWLDQQEARVERENTSVARVRLNLKITRMYFLAGFVAEAREDLITSAGPVFAAKRGLGDNSELFVQAVNLAGLLGMSHEEVLEGWSYLDPDGGQGIEL